MADSYGPPGKRFPRERVSLLSRTLKGITGNILDFKIFVHVFNRLLYYHKAKRACAAAQAQNEELTTKLGDAEKKVDQLQDSVQRLEEKLSNLESENQVLRQQALAISPTAKALSARPKTPILQRTPENGNVLNGEAKKQLDSSLALSSPREPVSEEKPQKSLNEKQQENQDLLIKCISQDLGFSGGRPIAAWLIYKSLLQWRSFEVERTSVFDRIIQKIGAAIEV